MRDVAVTDCAIHHLGSGCLPCDGACSNRWHLIRNILQCVFASNFGQFDLWSKDGTSSGYNEEETISHFHGKDLAGYIQKPYRPTKLIEKVREILLSRILRRV